MSSKNALEWFAASDRFQREVSELLFGLFAALVGSFCGRCDRRIADSFFDEISRMVGSFAKIQLTAVLLRLFYRFELRRNLELSKYVGLFDLFRKNPERSLVCHVILSESDCKSSTC